MTGVDEMPMRSNDRALAFDVFIRGYSGSYRLYTLAYLLKIYDGRRAYAMRRFRDRQQRR